VAAAAAEVRRLMEGFTVKRCLSFALLLLSAPGLYAKSAYPPPAEVRAAFKKLLDRPRVALDVKAVKPGVEDKTSEVAFYYYTFAAEKKADGTVERVPVVVVRPQKVEGKLPAVICLHGTGGTKEGQTAFMK